MPLLRRLTSLAAVLLLSLGACTAPPTGAVQLAASSSQALSASDVTRVKVTVSASDMTPVVIELSRANGTWGGLIGDLPAGANRTFLAEAFDASNTKRLEGQTSGVTITANQTTAVALTLQEISHPAPYGNEAPLLDSVVASSTSVARGGALSLTATARDPNPEDTLTYAWTATGGTFSAPSAAASSWTAPSSTGVQTLTLSVMDSQGAAVSLSLAINVVSGVSTGDAAVTISFNLSPVVSKVSASLNRLGAGQSTAVSATASDEDGDALSYQWTASCPGTWTDATSSAASFVPSSVPAGSCNNCRLTLTVQDGRGGQNTGVLNLCVATSSTERFAPRVTGFYQSATTIAAGRTVAFDVTALDPQSSTLTSAWSANTGLLAPAQTTATTSHIEWTAPSCLLPGVTPSITAVVTNAYGLSASKTFAVSGVPACGVSGWSSAGAMASVRRLHTATLLPSGKVLVAGGQNASSSLSQAELYDPIAKTWSSAAPMATARRAHTATRLPSGKVLVTGGINGTTYLPQVELYDAAANAWSSAAPMASARGSHSATLLSSGKVLIVGGYSGSAYLASGVLYDPATNSWSSTVYMSIGRSVATATLLTSGKVLVSAGDNNPNYPLASAEVYDPATSTWSSAGAMASSRYQFTATLLPSGQVLAVGGHNGAYLSSAELYTP